MFRAMHTAGTHPEAYLNVNVLNQMDRLPVQRFPTPWHPREFLRTAVLRFVPPQNRADPAEVLYIHCLLNGWVDTQLAGQLGWHVRGNGRAVPFSSIFPVQRIVQDAQADLARDNLRANANLTALDLENAGSETLRLGIYTATRARVSRGGFTLSHHTDPMNNNEAQGEDPMEVESDDTESENSSSSTSFDWEGDEPPELEEHDEPLEPVVEEHDYHDRARYDQEGNIAVEHPLHGTKLVDHERFTGLGFHQVVLIDWSMAHQEEYRLFERQVNRPPVFHTELKWHRLQAPVCGLCNLCSHPGPAGCLCISCLSENAYHSAPGTSAQNLIFKSCPFGHYGPADFPCSWCCCFNLKSGMGRRRFDGEIVPCCHEHALCCNNCYDQSDEKGSFCSNCEYGYYVLPSPISFRCQCRKHQLLCQLVPKSSAVETEYW